MTVKFCIKKNLFSVRLLRVVEQANSLKLRQINCKNLWIILNQSHLDGKLHSSHVNAHHRHTRKIMTMNWLLSRWKSATLKARFDLQNTKQEVTDLLQDNSTQLNKAKLEIVHRALHNIPVSRSFIQHLMYEKLQCTWDLSSIRILYRNSSTHDGSISVISHGNRTENSISDFRLQSEI